MTLREKLVLRIVLMVAKWLAPEPWQKDLTQLDAHISVHVKELP